MRLCVCCAFWCLVVLTTGCVQRDFDLDALRTPRDHSIEEARHVEILYSDSAVLRVRIEGPLLRRYIYRFRVEEEFPDGVHVEFFDGAQNPTAWLDARYAIRKPQELETIVQDDVVLRNVYGEKLEGSELIWNEKEQKITTEKLVRITRAEEIIYSRGFRSNQDFTDYELFAIEGEMLLRQARGEFDPPE